MLESIVVEDTYVENTYIPLVSLNRQIYMFDLYAKSFVKHDYGKYLPSCFSSNRKLWEPIIDLFYIFYVSFDTF